MCQNYGEIVFFLESFSEFWKVSARLNVEF